MKKLLYSLLAVGAVAGLASCASNEPLPGNGDGNVTVTVELPSFGTRFYGDTLNCNELIYSIYNMDGKKLGDDVVISAFENHGTSQTVNMQLVPGQSYMVAFYAHNNTSGFSKYEAGVISVDYSKLTANNEDHDAFFCYQQIDATAETAQKATLNRAFAQINFGTDDLRNAAVQDVIGDYTTNLSITGGLYNQLNIVPAPDAADKTVPTVSEPYTNTLSIDGTVTDNSNFAISGGQYGNLTSVYVLVGPEDKQVLQEGTYLIKNGETDVRSIPLANIPVRMNYRTNIYGTLLTTTLPVTVELRPAFDGEYIQGTDVTPETIADAIKNSTETDVALNLAPGKYTTSGISFKKNVNYTFNGTTDDCELSIVGNPVTSGDVVLRNLSIVTTNANFQGGFQGKSLTYSNCNLTGVTFLYAKKAVFDNCTLTCNANGYPLWTYGCGDLTMNNCTFVANVNGKGLLVYGGTKGLKYNVTLNNVKFTAGPDCAVSDKAGVEIHSEKFNPCAGGTIIINNCSAASQFGGGLWREIHNLDTEPATDYFTVYVDGKLVQQGTAE